jgi:Spy/CpxP family protein refolding chaperone
MSKTKKTLATALVALAAAATPVASLALSASDQPVHLACAGGGSGGCSG